MGLKWFRARLSINKEGTSEFPPMTGLYKKVSHSEYNTSAIPKSSVRVISSASPTISNDSIISATNEGVQNDCEKANFTAPLTLSSITDTEERGNDQAARNEEFSTSTKDSNIIRRSLMSEEESNKMCKEQTHTSDIKNRQENEIVI